ncbi:MAG TPA: sugar transferase [Mycobacteriales bacterium]|jgi:exopolysaccharide biosynthesis polyprenyl glycosylphosphotransferase|nr:sugar transferase [Mycobacteriales bacterium]
MATARGEGSGGRLDVPATRRERRLRRAGDADPSVIPEPVVPPRPRPAWESTYTLALVVVDAALISVAGYVALRGYTDGQALEGVPYTLIAAALAPVWVLVLTLSRAYEARFVGIGSDEFRRVFDASVRLLAAVATVAFTFRLPLSRGFVGVAFPLGTLLLLLGRYGARRVLHRLRDHGRAVHRVVVVGARDSVEHVVKQACDARHAGMLVVGVCVPDPERDLELDGVTYPALCVPADAARCVASVDADTVAVAGGWAMGAEGVRRLAWQLEGSGVDLVVAPSLTNVAGPRITIRPVAGLPLLHVEEPEFTGVRRLFKGAVDRTLATLVLVLASPLLLVVAVAVFLTDRGPVFFRQERVGQNGRSFRIWKFRSMYVDAEARRAELEERNEVDDVLFKMRRDPRVTPVGRILRRFSLDELPQVWNVVRGDMSLVGPRPPLPSEVARYGSDVRRRLLVKPGLTGLWQVSGRSDLTWEESVRLDLHYVENWSVALDAMILWKTVGAVLRGRGAY